MAFAQKTMCQKGLHAMTVENVRIETNKSAHGIYHVRRCKACQSARMKIYFLTYDKSKAKKRTVPNAQQPDQL